MAAALEVFRNGAWHELTSLKVYRSGAWRTLKTLKVYSGGAWRLIANFLQPLTASASPTNVHGGDSNLSASVVTSNSTTVTPSGGLGPFSYAWADVGGQGVSATAPASASSAFYKTISGSVTVVTTMRCTVTDANGSATTVDVSVTLTHGVF